MVVLVLAAVVGVVRAALGLSWWVGTTVNLLWVGYDLVVLSVVLRALLYRGYPGGEAVTEPGRERRPS